jgi:hypothetical protein
MSCNSHASGPQQNYVQVAGTGIVRKWQVVFSESARPHRSRGLLSAYYVSTGPYHRFHIDPSPIVHQIPSVCHGSGGAPRVVCTMASMPSQNRPSRALWHGVNSAKSLAECLASRVLEDGELVLVTATNLGCEVKLQA